jgi:hypothetical protein
VLEACWTVSSRTGSKADAVPASALRRHLHQLFIQTPSFEFHLLVLLEMTSSPKRCIQRRANCIQALHVHENMIFINAGDRSKNGESKIKN